MARLVNKNLLSILGLVSLVGLTVIERPTEGILTFLLALLVKPNSADNG